MHCPAEGLDRDSCDRYSRAADLGSRGFGEPRIWGRGAMAQVIGVHGMAQQHSGRNQLLMAWEPALRDGIELALGRDAPAPMFDLAFYGELFLSKSARGTYAGEMKGVLADDLVAAFSDVDEEELEFLNEAAREAVALRPDLGAPMGTPRVPSALRPIARQLTRRFDGSLVLTFVRALRQVRLYLEDEELAGAIRAVVVDSIGGGCRVLVAHSLGSVVAFDTLSRNPDVRVDTLVTLGSPLAMRAVTTRLRGSASEAVPAAIPGQLRRWVNIFDPADPVAAAGVMHRVWPASQDYTVDNEDDPHAIQRYLSKRITGEVVAAGVHG
jgi:hypothetical protein